MELEHRVGDRVRLTPEGVRCYGGAWPHWVPETQGGGTDGTVLFAGERPHKPGAAPRPYYVRWDNGVENSYREVDLMAAQANPEMIDPAIPVPGEAVPGEAVPGEAVPGEAVPGMAEPEPFTPGVEAPEAGEPAEPQPGNVIPFGRFPKA